MEDIFRESNWIEGAFGLFASYWTHRGPTFKLYFKGVIIGQVFKASDWSPSHTWCSFVVKHPLAEKDLPDYEDLGCSYTLREAKRVVEEYWKNNMSLLR